MKFSLTPYIGFFNPVNYSPIIGEIVSQFDGILVGSRDGVLGDHPVSHDAIDGDLFLCPGIVSGFPSTNLIPVYSVLGSSVHPTHVGGAVGSTRGVVHYVGGTPVTYQHRNVTIRYEVLTSQRMCAIGYTMTGQYYYRRKWRDTSVQASYITVYSDDMRTARSGSLPSYNPTVGLREKDFTLSAPRPAPAPISVGQYSKPSLHSLKEFEERVRSRSGLHPNVDERRIFGDLAQRCIDQQKSTDVMSIPFIRDLGRIRELIPRKGKIFNPKTWSDLYLWYSYGVKPTTQDIQGLKSDVANAISTAAATKDNVFHSSASESITDKDTVFAMTYRYKVTCEPVPSRLMSCIRTLWSWNLYPNLETCWELIPFSFVVDWFIDIQSICQDLDDQILYEYYNILGVCHSTKAEYSIPASAMNCELNLLGDINYVTYRRGVRNALHLPVLSFDVSKEFSNHAELTALIVSNRR